MRHSFLKTILFLFLFVISAQVIDRYFFDHKITNIGPNLIKSSSSSIFYNLENGRFFLKSLIKIRSLISKNNNLRRDNISLLSRLADYEDIKAENDFLRSSLKIAHRFKGEVVYASIFNAQLGPSGYDVLLTKGTSDNISERDVVITEQGILLGRVKKSYDNFSNLLLAVDREFNVTAKVLGSSTTGIAKGAMEKGLYLDLVVQDDPIKEGDVIVSSGIDFFPPALIIGTVNHVDTSETDIFKKVKIQPAFNDVKIGRVLVIKNNTRQ